MGVEPHTYVELLPQVSINAVRANVAKLHAELVRYNLIVWTGGNVSGRVPGADLFVIKPSGVSYDDPTDEVEDVARTVHYACEAGPLIPIPQEPIDRLYDRYQNVYGPSGDERRDAEETP